MLHYDVRFIVFAPEGAQPVGNHESQDLKWVPLDEVDGYDLDEGHHRMIKAGKAVAEHLMSENA